MMVTTRQAVLVPTVVLYDIMYEAGTRLKGTIIGLRRENPADAAALTAQLHVVTDRVESVDVDDRDAIAALTVEFREEYDRLNTV